MGNENKIVDGQVQDAAVMAKTGVSREILSIIQTEQSGFLVSISRNIKVGRVATEISTVRMEGYAKNLEEAFVVLGNLDHATMQFIKNEGALYGIDLAAAPNKLSPIENKKE